MQIWISGGTGLIGRALAQQFREDGYAVSCLSRRAAGGNTFAWDAAAGAPFPALPAPDAVISLAGEPVAQRWTPEVKQRIRESRVLGTLHLVEALGALPTPPQILISASATGYYGDCGDAVLDEQSPNGSDFLASVCSEWEAAALSAERFGIPVCILRVSVVLAREGGALAKMLPPFRWGVGGKMGSGDQWMPWIALPDLVALFRFVLAHRRTGIYNATSPEPVRNRDLAKALGRVLHRPALLPLPAAALRVMFGEMASALLSSQRVLPRALPEFRFTYPEIEHALESLLTGARASS